MMYSYLKMFEDLVGNGYFKEVEEVQEVKDKVIIRIEMPGVKKSDISIKLVEDMLNVKWSKGERKYRLDSKLDKEGIESKYEDGLLEIFIKIKDKKERLIEIT